MWETYGLGVTDAMAHAADPKSPFHRPGRRITLIHRAHQADLEAIVDTFKALPGSDRGLGESTLAFSFKYSQAHMHSSTAPKFIFQNGWYDSMPAGKQTWLTVRNDDLYYLRWGDPDFVRRYWRQLPQPDRIAGFMLGPDGYTWGRDFVSTRGADAAPARHREAVVLVPAVGPARLRADDPERALQRDPRGALPAGRGRQSFGGADVDVEDPAAGQPLLLGLFRLPVVSGGLLEPGRLRRRARLHHAEVSADARGRRRRDAAHHVGEGVRRSRVDRRPSHAAGGGERDRPARRRRCPTNQHRAGCGRARVAGHARRHPCHGGARALLRRQDPRRRRARALRDRRRTPRRMRAPARRCRRRRSTGASTPACGARRTSATSSPGSVRRWST